jgi:hypothetical protein
MSESARFLFAAVALTVAQPAYATAVYWNGTGATDHIDWGQLGPPDSVVATGTAVSSTGGLDATVTSTDFITRTDQGSSGNLWHGDFAPGEHLLFDQESDDGILTIIFDSPVSSAGAQIQSNFQTAFVARITLNDGTSFDIPGVSGGNAGDTNPFLGAISDSANILSISFSVPTGGGAGFAISEIDLNGSGPLSSVPEPATWAMMLMGFGAIGSVMRRKRSSQNMPHFA